MARYGTVDETWGEINIYGGLNSSEVVERLIVCDGQPSRGFRKTLFNKELLLCGIAAGPHKELDNIIQIEYVNALLEVGQTPSVKV